MDIGLEQKLAAETGRVSWSELKVHYDRGVLVRVGPTLDLVTVAAAIARDQTVQVSEWLESGAIARVTAEEAADWKASGMSLRAIVVAPWVLVQAD